MVKQRFSFCGISRRAILRVGALSVANMLLPPFLPGYPTQSRELPSAPKSSSRLPPSNFTILVSLADPHLEVLLKLLLNRTGGMQVLTAPLTQDAYKCCREHPISLVISDVYKVGLYGDKLLQMIRADKATSHVPFLFYTARSDTEFIQKAFALGADAYLTIPSPPKALFAAISHFLPVEQPWPKTEVKWRGTNISYALVVSDDAPTLPESVLSFRVSDLPNTFSPLE